VLMPKFPLVKSFFCAVGGGSRHLFLYGGRRFSSRDPILEFELSGI
jgi:hypothetical protein